MKQLKRRLQVLLFVFLLVTAAGTFGFMVLEDLTLREAFYYNIVTMSTVGYGDIHPTNPGSQMFAVLIIIMGAATFLGVIANTTEMLILKRETKARRRKVNMVLGAFFSEVGYALLDTFSDLDHNLDGVRTHVVVKPEWKEGRFSWAEKSLRHYPFKVEIDQDQLQHLSTFLLKKRHFLLGLIENPALVEDEDFTEALLAVFHMLDELNCRKDLTQLPSADQKHLAGDMSRAYRRLTVQWIRYLKHLKGQYPYLFSLAVRQNPFDPHADPVIRDD